MLPSTFALNSPLVIAMSVKCEWDEIEWNWEYITETGGRSELLLNRVNWPPPSANFQLIVLLTILSHSSLSNSSQKYGWQTLFVRSQREVIHTASAEYLRIRWRSARKEEIEIIIIYWRTDLSGRVGLGSVVLCRGHIIWLTGQVLLQFEEVKIRSALIASYNRKRKVAKYK